jgi:hypothetical protein
MIFFTTNLLYRGRRGEARKTSPLSTLTEVDSVEASGSSSPYGAGRLVLVFRCGKFSSRMLTEIGIPTSVSRT